MQLAVVRAVCLLLTSPGLVAEEDKRLDCAQSLDVIEACDTPRGVGCRGARATSAFRIVRSALRCRTEGPSPSPRSGPIRRKCVEEVAGEAGLVDRPHRGRTGRPAPPPAPRDRARVDPSRDQEGERLRRYLSTCRHRRLSCPPLDLARSAGFASREGSRSLPISGSYSATFAALPRKRLWPSAIGGSEVSGVCTRNATSNIT